VLTAHAGVDYRSLVRWSKLVFDTRGVTSSIESPNVVRL
jgi:hypothetical protein